MQTQEEWSYQWGQHSDKLWDKEEILFWEWLEPLSPDDFRGKRVLDAGCGAGHMLSYLVPLIQSGVGVDMSTAAIARARLAQERSISIYEGDVSRFDQEKDFDIVYSIGVVHHTDNPSVTVHNLMNLVRPGGRLALWVYSREGNWLNWAVLEPLKTLFFRKLPRSFLWFVANFITGLLYLPIYTLYLLPIRALPYYEYFEHWRRLPFSRNALNVFDKLNAPVTHFISRADIQDWFRDAPFHSLTVSHWKGVGWRVSAVKDSD
ncbi:MAG: class I SAM-dependent methyltransferase [Thermodesulfobacteriota bacterium]